ncbi:capsular biosynthesis protein [Caulobacter sp. CCNWLY153]|uniref:capsule biosynthesis protein n=1 Tax=unclassified Caulobacter TaxID=2648921 RepID=UPI002FF2F1A9
MIRQILFLQGPPGRFLADLADELSARSHGVHRVNFNGGDRLSWRLPGAVDFRAPPHDWPRFLGALLTRRGITDIVLFGDCRPLHRAAALLARERDVTLHVFEEGYIRPDWITLERDGVNAHSPLAKDPHWYRTIGAGLPEVESRTALPSSLHARALACLAYHAAEIALRPLFPHHRTHRPWGPLTEARGWAARLLRHRATEKRSLHALHRLADNPYFVLPLQLDSDYQLRVHSTFHGMRPALRRVLTSFARHAPRESVLVVKTHPLDNGLVDWRRVTLALACANGVAERVVFVEGGDIAELVAGSRGVVTVNSTTGTLALAAGRAVMVLGRAIYDMAGLTHQGALDNFWTAPIAPDPDLYEAFRRVLAGRCLIAGGFYARHMKGTLAAAADRILAPAPSSSASPSGVRGAHPALASAG